MQIKTLYKVDQGTQSYHYSRVKYTVTGAYMILNKRLYSMVLTTYTKTRFGEVTKIFLEVGYLELFGKL